MTDQQRENVTPPFIRVIQLVPDANDVGSTPIFRVNIIGAVPTIRSRATARVVRIQMLWRSWYWSWRYRAGVRAGRWRRVNIVPAGQRTPDDAEDDTDTCESADGNEFDSVFFQPRFPGRRRLSSAAVLCSGAQGRESRVDEIRHIGKDPNCLKRYIYSFGPERRLRCSMDFRHLYMNNPRTKTGRCC